MSKSVRFDWAFHKRYLQSMESSTLYMTINLSCDSYAPFLDKTGCQIRWDYTRTCSVTYVCIYYTRVGDLDGFVRTENTT